VAFVRFVMPSRTAGTARAAAGIVVTVLLGVTVCAASARAQARLDAVYEASLAGLPIGKGGWAIEVADDQYSMAVSGGTTGLMKSIGGGNGTGTAHGRIVAGQFAPQSYLSTVHYGKKAETIRISLAGGNVKDTAIEPEPPVNPERVPVTEAHLRNVLDPMTGAVLRVPGNGDPVSPEACRKTLSVFDGRMRYDLRLDYKRMDKVKAEKGYQGPVVVCAVYFLPIAGHVPDRVAIKYVAAQRNMEIWFAPIASTRVLVPFRVAIPTPLGTGLLEATEFVSVQKTARTN
jgi:hypothetical protein